MTQDLFCRNELNGDTINICCIVLKLKSWYVIREARIGLILTHLTFHIYTFYILYSDKLIALLMGVIRNVGVMACAKVLSLYLIALIMMYHFILPGHTSWLI